MMKLNQQKPDPKRKIKEGKKKKKKKPNNQLNKNLTINLNNKKNIIMIYIKPIPHLQFRLKRSKELKASKSKSNNEKGEKK